MSISKAKILGSFIEYPLPENQITKEALNLSELLLSKESLHPSITSEQSLISEVYIRSTNDNWRSQNYNNNNKNDFKRGHSYQNKEDLINIEIENIYLFNDNTNIPKDKESFYLKDHYQNITGPFSSDNIIEMYKGKKIDSTYFFRPIDIYSFKEHPLFYFLPITTLNEKDWSYKIMDNPLLQYTELFKTTQKLFELPPKKTQEKKSENIKKEDIKEKEDLKEEKEDIKEENKINQKKIQTISKQETYIKEEEDGEWEDPNRRKRKVRPQKKENENKQIPVGLQINKNDIKINSANTIIKNNPKNNPVNNNNNNTNNNTNNDSDDLLEMLRPKKQNQKEEKPINIEDYIEVNEEYRESYQGGKNKKKKKRPQQANNNINLGFKY